jgi:hypothetical protein
MSWLNEAWGDGKHEAQIHFKEGARDLERELSLESHLLGHDVASRRGVVLVPEVGVAGVVGMVVW